MPSRSPSAKPASSETPAPRGPRRPARQRPVTHAVVALVDRFAAQRDGRVPADRGASTWQGIRGWLSIPQAAGIPAENVTLLVSGAEHADGYGAEAATAANLRSALRRRFAEADEAGGTLLFCYSGRGLPHRGGYTLMGADTTDRADIGVEEARAWNAHALGPIELGVLLDEVSRRGMLVVADVRGRGDESPVRPSLRRYDRLWWWEGGRWAESADLVRAITWARAAEARDRLRPPAGPATGVGGQVGSDHFFRYVPSLQHLTPAPNFFDAALYVAGNAHATAVYGYLLVRRIADHGVEETWAIAPTALAGNVYLWPLKRDGQTGGFLQNEALALIESVDALHQPLAGAAQVKLATLRGEAPEVVQRWVGYGTVPVDVPPTAAWYELREEPVTEEDGRAWVRADAAGLPDLRPDAWFREADGRDLKHGDRLRLSPSPTGPSGTAYRGLSV